MCTEHWPSKGKKSGRRTASPTFDLDVILYVTIPNQSGCAGTSNIKRRPIEYKWLLTQLLNITRYAARTGMAQTRLNDLEPLTKLEGMRQVMQPNIGHTLEHRQGPELKTCIVCLNC